jgi:hypothetical protein
MNVWGFFQTPAAPQCLMIHRVPSSCFMKYVILNRITLHKIFCLLIIYLCELTKNYIPFNSVFFSTVEMKYIIVNPIIKTCLSRMESITNSANIFFAKLRRNRTHIWNRWVFRATWHHMIQVQWKWFIIQ